MHTLQPTIEAAWQNRELLQNAETRATIEAVVNHLDAGTLRVAEPTQNGWQVNEWIKKAVILYFPIKAMETIEVGPFEFHDKIPLKKNYAALGVRVVPHAIARHGSFVAPGVIMMPS
jgi:2,3,4,5-tetrahydropyridine-2-carboxylate N-succinyltransferase